MEEQITWKQAARNGSASSLLWMVITFPIAVIAIMIYNQIDHMANKPAEPTYQISRCVETASVGCNWAGQKYNKSSGQHLWSDGSPIGE